MENPGKVQFMDRQHKERRSHEALVHSFQYVCHLPGLFALPFTQEQALIFNIGCVIGQLWLGSIGSVQKVTVQVLPS